MSDELRAWLEEVRDERNQAQVALQNGDDGPMRLWALRHGHVLIAQCEELADELHHAIDHHVVRGDNLTICVECGHRNKHAQGCWVGEAENALRAPGVGKRADTPSDRPNIQNWTRLEALQTGAGAGMTSDTYDGQTRPPRASCGPTRVFGEEVRGCDS